MNTPIVDIHTHNLEALPPAVISVSPGVELDPSRLYSVGVHPWDTAAFDGDYTELERMAAMPNVVAIGETGLDALRGAPLERQEEIFRRHIEIAERVGKPLVLHVVKAWGRLLKIAKAYRPPRQTAGHGGLLTESACGASPCRETVGNRGPLAAGKWVVHGFRGKAELARQLLATGMDISLGEKFNPEAARVIPAERLHFETDCSSLPVEQIAARVMAARDA
ncbi:MAG: TatD family hydrolase [Bacteroidales bacterium]|nr:TatD family hydrolase [Bacteroidales bacterium]MCD8395436.1 TatD family hydrolase [Bacteroidales bacterium]